MAATGIAEVQDQVQKFWSPMFMSELREKLMLGALVNRDYQGSIGKEGDEVTVSQINAPEGSMKTIGVDEDSFESEQLSVTEVKIKADKRAVAAFEFKDIVKIQSQLGSKDSELRQSLVFSVLRQINDYLYSLVNPLSPTHVLSGVTDFNASQLLIVRKLAAQAKWAEEKGWWLLQDPSYYNDILNAQTLTSSDYVGDEKVVVGGKVANKRFGFNILEDNSRGILKLSPASTGADVGLAFHPDFMHLVMQTEPTFEISKLHANKKFGFLMSVDLILGAKLGIDGDKKHIKIYNT